MNRSELFHGPTSKNGFLSRIIGSAFLLLAITASVATAKDVSGYIDDVDVSGRLIIVDGEPYAARTSATLRETHSFMVSSRSVAKASLARLAAQARLQGPSGHSISVRERPPMRASRSLLALDPIVLSLVSRMVS